MIESFGIDKVSVARWAGITSAVFSLSQCVTAVAWGRASDRFGRKPVILIGLFVTMCTSLFWGLSRNLPMAITARVLSGGSNGNVGIIRTMVAEMVQNNKELQPRVNLPVQKLICLLTPNRLSLSCLSSGVLVLFLVQPSVVSSHSLRRNFLDYSETMHSSYVFLFCCPIWWLQYSSQLAF